MKQILLFILPILSLSVSAQEALNTKLIHVEPHLGFENYEHFKRLVIKSKDSEADFIEGFDFKWGYYYELQVQEIKLSSTLSDGTRFDYKLDKIITQEKAPEDTTFLLFIDPQIYYYKMEDEAEGQSLKAINDSTYLYLEKVEIVVPELLQVEFKSLAAGDVGKRGEFEFVNEQRIRLVQWK